MPAVIQIEEIPVPEMPKLKPALVRIRVQLDETTLKLPEFGHVSHVWLKRYKAGSKSSEDSEVIVREIDRRTGTADVTLPISALRELRLVIDCDTSRFRPCSGGSLVYRVREEEE